MSVHRPLCTPLLWESGGGEGRVLAGAQARPSATRSRRADLDPPLRGVEVFPRRSRSALQSSCPSPCRAQRGRGRWGGGAPDAASTRALRHSPGPASSPQLSPPHAWGRGSKRRSLAAHLVTSRTRSCFCPSPCRAQRGRGRLGGGASGAGSTRALRHSPGPTPSPQPSPPPAWGRGSETGTLGPTAPPLSRGERGSVAPP